MAGILVGDPVVVGGGGLGVGVVGVLVHELERGGEGALDYVYGFGDGPEPCGVDVRVAGEVEGGLLQDGLEGLEFLTGCGEGGIELRLVGGVEGGEVDGGDGLIEGGEVLCGIFGERGQEGGAGEEFGAEVGGVGTAGGEVDLHGRAVEGLGVDGVEELDGDEDLVAGLGLVEEDDGLEVVTEGYAAAVEVDDLRHGAVGGGAELEPDAGSGEVVAVEVFGDFDEAAEPDGVVGGVAAGLDDGPGGVVEVGVFAVGEVAYVGAPFVGREVVEGAEAFDDFLGVGGRGWR